MKKNKIDMIVDLQYGSTGKGLIAGYLSRKNEYDVVVNANMPNAGHTFIDTWNNKMVHKVLPSGIASPRLETVLIGPGSVFSYEVLMNEVSNARKIGYLAGAKILIHPNAVPLKEAHVKSEEALGSIGSTKQGSMGAMIDKMQRPTTRDVIARDVIKGEKAGVRVASIDEYNSIVRGAEKILAEGAQGFSLGINEGFYPFCTSRDCSPARFMSDMNLPLYYLNKVIGCARTYPIRVGGTSGGSYPNQKELSWKEVNQIPEKTTVTNRERRVFAFSGKQIKDAIYITGADEIFLNFCNYCETNDELVEIIKAVGSRLKYTGWGPKETNIGVLE